MEVSKPPVRWLRAYWDEEDTTFYFEVDEDGWVLRQVEFSGADRTPTVAASLAEWPDAERDGLAAVQAYEARYGGIADQPLPPDQPPDAPHVIIDRVEFVEVWQRARTLLGDG